MTHRVWKPNFQVFEVIEILLETVPPRRLRRGALEKLQLLQEVERLDAQIDKL
jgi:hypothetical protein